MKLVKQQTTPKLIDKRYLIPSILMVGLVPLISRAVVYNAHLSQYDWYPDGKSMVVDFFLLYKQWTVVILACVCGLLLLVRAKYYFEELPLKKFMIPAGVYGIFVLLSAIFGKSSLHAFAGTYEMFESALALLSYLVICYYTYVSVVSRDHLLYFLHGSEYFVLAELLIAYYQGLGFDLFSTKFGGLLILPSSLRAMGSVQVMSGRTQAYGTLYNVDYFSMYIGALFPICLMLVLVEEKWQHKLFNGILMLLSVFVLLHGASSGIIGIAGALVICWIVLSANNKRTLGITFIVIAVLVGFSIGALYMSDGLRQRVADFLVQPGTLEEEDIPVREIYTNDDDVEIDFRDGRELHLAFSINDSTGVATIKASDGEGKDLGLTCENQDQQVYTFNSAVWQDLYLTRAGDEYSGYYCNVYLKSNDRVISFIHNEETGSYYLRNFAGKSVKMPIFVEKADVFPDGFFALRGHIYNRCLPLLKKNIFIGVGANNFMFAYPQWDYIDKIFRPGGSAYDVRPHSYYLQVWIENGFIAFLSLMTFFGWYLVDSIRLYRKAVWKSIYEGMKQVDGDSTRRLAMVGFGIFTGAVAYLIVEIANDSMICTAPVFWTILGAGWAVNGLVKKSLKMPPAEDFKFPSLKKDEKSAGKQGRRR